MPRGTPVLQGVDFTGLKRNREYFGTPDKSGPIFQVASWALQIWEKLDAIAEPVNPGEIIATNLIIAGGR